MALRSDIEAKAHRLRYARRRRRKSGATALRRPDPMVTMLAVTNRPDGISAILDTFRRQTYRGLELVVISNHEAVDVAPAAESGARVSSLPADASLGACLNHGLDLATGEVIARVDDDDLYGDRYIEHAVADLAMTDAVIVGKAGHFAWLEATSELVYRFAHLSNRYVHRMPGGSITMHRPSLGDLRFRDISLGEDTAFIRDCERRGGRVWSGAPHGFVQVRRSTADSHTWRIELEQYRRGSEVVGYSCDESIWDPSA